MRLGKIKNNTDKIFQELKKSGNINVVSVKEIKGGSVVKFHLTGQVEVKNKHYILDHYIMFFVPVDFPKRLPIIKEYKNSRIPLDYGHMNADGSFCLATDFDLYTILQKSKHNISKYIDIIAQFIGIYEYYKSYGIYPYGDRAHGLSGIFQGYKDFFEIQDDISLVSIFNYDKLSNKLKNKSCYCGSSQKLKNCHWRKLQIIFNNPHLKKQYLKDRRRLKK